MERVGGVEQSDRPDNGDCGGATVEVVYERGPARGLARERGPGVGPRAEWWGDGEQTASGWGSRGSDTGR